MKNICIFLIAIVTAVIPVFTDEIPNTIGAVKSARPGDYIVLLDGSHYVLVEEEIAIVNNEFDYDNDDNALRENGVPRSDGGKEYHITPSHKRIIWPDGKSMDVLTTRRAFDDYIQFVAANYDPMPFTMYDSIIGNTHPVTVPEGLETFRGKVYHTFLTNGVDTFVKLEAREFNRSITGEGLQRGFQMKGGDIVYTLTGGGNLWESGVSRDE